MNYADIFAEHIRISVLRFMAEEAPNCNDSILHDVLVKKFKIKCSRDQVRSQLAWLKEQGLITFDVLASGTYTASIFQRGIDVASGNIFVPGVKRPSIEDFNG